METSLLQPTQHQLCGWSNMLRATSVCQFALTTVLICTAASAQAITGAKPTTAFEGVGRGVQVAPDWVLTAQHNSWGVGETYVNAYGSRTVAARYDAPGSGQFPANDLTLLRLAPAVSSAPFISVLDAPVPVGMFAPLDVTLVSAANSGPARGFAFSTVSESLMAVDPDGAGPLEPVVVNWLVSRDSVVHVQGNDSSGALFAGHVTNNSLLLGIASALISDSNRRPVGSAFVQPAAYRAWIDGTMAADLTDNQTLLWTAAAVPEPSTWALGAAGLVVLWARSRRRDKPRNQAEL